MNRRKLLRGMAIGVPAAALAVTGGIALADATATADFGILTTEQVANKVMFFKKNAAFSNANMYRSFSPGTGGWSNLSDCRVRNTASFGAIGLVAASGGKVGIWNITDEKHQELNDLLWSATPGGNPHSLERIPDIGAFVSASSAGYLTVYAPTAISRPSTLAKVQTVDLAEAHSVLWDPQKKWLWAAGNKTVRAYTVTGTYRNTRLKYTGKSVALSGMGHDLQPDYSNKNKLTVTDSYGVYEIDKTAMTKKEISGTNAIKAYVRHSSGEAFWVQADNKGSRTWGSPTVNFSKSTARTRSGAEFYKARFDNPNYN